ncbi:MAG: hypothetical protein ABIP71_15060, partial [Verrucomicrobiota bacterium]
GAQGIFLCASLDLAIRNWKILTANFQEVLRRVAAGTERVEIGPPSGFNAKAVGKTGELICVLALKLVAN